MSLLCIDVVTILPVMYGCSDLYVHADLGLWISHPDLGQPSQISDHGKNVTLSTNGPTVKTGIEASPLWAQEQDGPPHISIDNALAAQVCLYGNKSKE
jgi:hypothetical protein